MDPTTTPTDPVSRPKPNGILARNNHHHHHHHAIIRHHHPPPPPPPPLPLYRECVKNHAAALGCHALDGCCEFMPSPSSNPSDPSSLTCAACGCHRNFHRRADHGCGGEDSAGGGGGASSHNDDTDDDGGRRLSASPPPPSAPHMLLALSAAGEGLSPPAAGPAARTSSKKRFRSRFSPEQKDRMQELSERLGWRMQRRHEGIIEEVCREIGVGRRVFKVWMHNNKHNFVLKNTTTNSNGSSSNAAGDGIDGESHVHHHHHHRDNGVSGSADSSP